MDNNQLLRNKKAVDEINRHRWIESEKAGYDIGFENASVDWLKKFSSAWMQYHMPKRNPSSGSVRPAHKAKSSSKKTPKKKPSSKAK